MKKKIAMLSVSGIIAISATTSAFAMENKEIINLDNNNKFEIENILTNIESIENAENPPIVLYGNERYRYTTKIVFSNKKSKSMNITKKMAATERKYAKYLRTFANAFYGTFLSANVKGILAGEIINLATKKYYRSPYESAGKYTITTQSVREVKTNVITKRSYVSRTGYHIQVSFKGKSTSKTYWMK